MQADAAARAANAAIAQKQTDVRLGAMQPVRWSLFSASGSVCGAFNRGLLCCSFMCKPCIHFKLLHDFKSFSGGGIGRMSGRR